MPVNSDFRTRYDIQKHKTHQMWKKYGD